MISAKTFLDRLANAPDLLENAKKITSGLGLMRNHFFAGRLGRSAVARGAKRFLRTPLVRTDREEAFGSSSQLRSHGTVGDTT